MGWLCLSYKEGGSLRNRKRGEKAKTTHDFSRAQPYQEGEDCSVKKSVGQKKRDPVSKKEHMNEPQEGGLHFAFTEPEENFGERSIGTLGTGTQLQGYPFRASRGDRRIREEGRSRMSVRPSAR